MIDSGRGDHVVQLTVERYLPAAAAVPEADIPAQFELKVSDARIAVGSVLHFSQLSSWIPMLNQDTDISELCCYL